MGSWRCTPHRHIRTRNFHRCNSYLTASWSTGMWERWRRRYTVAAWRATMTTAAALPYQTAPRQWSWHQLGRGPGTVVRHKALSRSTADSIARFPLPRRPQTSIFICDGERVLSAQNERIEKACMSPTSTVRPSGHFQAWLEPNRPRGITLYAHETGSNHHAECIKPTTGGDAKHRGFSE